MAKIKFGMMMTDARGKLGGQVFSKNRSGSYVRTKVTPVNPSTSAQTDARSLFGAISQQWSGLSESVRDGWNGAVSDWQKTDIFGDLKLPSGKALFQRLNNQAQSAGLPAVNLVPAKLEMVEGVVSSATIDTSGPEITLTDAYNGADANIVLFATTSLSQGTKFVKNRLRQIYAVQASTYDSFASSAAYTSKFGQPTPGDNIYLAIKYVLPNGQASPLQIIKASVI